MPTDRLAFDASLIARIHTYLAYSAFSAALFVGCLLHYKKIVKNGVAAYPDEWFPSVSATIGDWYPERNVFQLLIALTSGPRFGLITLLYFIQRSRSSSWPAFVYVIGILRTLLCGGWVYVTSSDDHDFHDFAMITYIVFNLPWMVGSIALSPGGSKARRRRTLIASTFFASIVPMILYFIQHKVQRIPGAYSKYSLFEWGLVFLDIAFDSVAEESFGSSNLQILIGSSISEPTSNDATPQSASKARSTDDITDLSVAQESSTSGPFNTSPNSSEDLASHNLSYFTDRATPSFLSDIYFSYVFWSIFTSLIPTIFYFSVWELGIAGQELLLLSVLSPIVFHFIPPFFDWAKSRPGLVSLHHVSHLGLFAYITNSPLRRLLMVAPAAGAAMLAQVATWTSAENGVWYQSTVTSLGFLIASLTKQFNYSNNPIWPNVNKAFGGYHNVGFALILLSTVELWYRPETSTRHVRNQKNSEAGLVSTAVPLGSVFFALHNLLTDPGTLIAWSWTGYSEGAPNGPVPNVHGSLTLIAQCVGLGLSIIVARRSIEGHPLLHPLWYLYGLASTYVLYAYRDWKGYVGGLNCAVFLTSLFPLIIQNAASQRAETKMAKTYFVAMVIYCVFIVLSTFTVAYAFVPGGQYLRERTDLILIAQTLCLLPAFLAFKSKSNHRAEAVQSTLLPPRITSIAGICISVISILSLLSSLYRLPITPKPFKPGPRIITTGIWTLHFGMDNQGRDSQWRVKRVISDMQIDIVGFLESDLHRPVFGNRDMTQYIASEMGYYVDLGPGPNAHTWGAALLSKFPIVNSTHHLLPSPHGELAPAIEAVLDVFGTMVTVIVAHNGQEEDPLDRELQSTKLAQIMSDADPRPLIFLGYVVTSVRHSRPAPYGILKEEGRVHDIDQDDLDRWCEYIFYRGLYRTAYARISRGLVTDTELQIGQFQLPRHGSNVTDDSEPARYQRAFKEQLPEDHWFPMEYYNFDGKGGVNDHYYHVFNTPLYYKLPEDALL